MEPLYVVVRKDIASGLQLAQACHATREFTKQWPEDGVGENLVVLEAPLDQLHFLAHRARMEETCHLTLFYEPDLGGELTAVAFGAGARKMLSQLPLAGRDRSSAAA